MSRTHASGFGTIGAAFLNLEALNRHAILKVHFYKLTGTEQNFNA